MKALRTIGISVLVAVLLLGSVGTVFAEKPTDVPPGKGLKFQGQQKRGFSGNVTDVDITDGNVTITLTKQGSSVPVRLTERERVQYKIPGVMNKWGNLSQFKEQLEGDLAALEGRRVVTLAGNVSGKWEALKLLLLPVPGLPALHAHRTGVVDDFTPGVGGNITIVDIHGVPHTFDLAGNATYHPKKFSDLELEYPEELDGAVTGSFVTVVIKGDPKVEPGDKAIAKAVVVHPKIPEGWSIP